ncbi:MAG: hypothetical protein JST00_21115 [Deltaproteobacteria bacterium]|nr:hypothetical protein [Deltaproteobacteria bacterium]
MGSAQLAMREERARLAEEIARHRPPPPQLQNLRIASPCSASWEKMTGDDKVRFCGDCKKHVYNVSAMTHLEAEALLEGDPEGQKCVRFFERADGTILTADCPVGVRKKERRKLALAVLGGTAMWGAGVAAVASTLSGLVSAEREPQLYPTEFELRKPDPGTLAVIGEPGTRVVIDGEISTTLPAAVFDLGPGPHQVRLEYADRSGAEVHSVMITSGQRIEVRQERNVLPPPPPPAPRPPGRWLAGGRVSPSSEIYPGFPRHIKR